MPMPWQKRGGPSVASIEERERALGLRPPAPPVAQVTQAEPARPAPPAGPSRMSPAHRGMTLADAFAESRRLDDIYLRMRGWAMVARRGAAWARSDSGNVVCAVEHIGAAGYRLSICRDDPEEWFPELDGRTREPGTWDELCVKLLAGGLPDTRPVWQPMPQGRARLPGEEEPPPYPEQGAPYPADLAPPEQGPPPIPPPPNVEPIRAEQGALL